MVLLNAPPTRYETALRLEIQIDPLRLESQKSTTLALPCTPRTRPLLAATPSVPLRSLLLERPIEPRCSSHLLHISARADFAYQPIGVQRKRPAQNWLRRGTRPVAGCAPVSLTARPSSTCMPRNTKVASAREIVALCCARSWGAARTAPARALSLQCAAVCCSVCGLCAVRCLQCLPRAFSATRGRHPHYACAAQLPNARHSADSSTHASSRAPLSSPLAPALDRRCVAQTAAAYPLDLDRFSTESAAFWALAQTADFTRKIRIVASPMCIISIARRARHLDFFRRNGKDQKLAEVAQNNSFLTRQFKRTRAPLSADRNRTSAPHCTHNTSAANCTRIIFAPHCTHAHLCSAL